MYQDVEPVPLAAGELYQLFLKRREMKRYNDRALLREHLQEARNELH